MTKRDYELIARVLADFSSDSQAYRPDERLCQQFADVLAQDNPRFDRQKFLTACGVAEACLECHMAGSHKMDCSRNR